MPYLTDEQIAVLSDDSFKYRRVFISRGPSKIAYTLICPHKVGMKGVVWRAKDDLGNNVALKIIPSADYAERSLIDEMTDATKLDHRYFAEIHFFGDFELEERTSSIRYKAISTKWVEGAALDEFLTDYRLTVEDFVSIAESLFRGIASLRRNGLCHDDLHPGNVLLEKVVDDLTDETVLALKIIDTGTVKSLSTRDRLMKSLRDEFSILQRANSDNNKIQRLKDFLDWKTPDDHLRATECLLYAANALSKNYSRLSSWERKFIDGLLPMFQRLVDDDITRRLDDPPQVLSEFKALVEAAQNDDKGIPSPLSSPFDYISAEMIRNDLQFSELFSTECPWLAECESLEPLYIYGPRGCGKSSVLRWLSFKTVISDPNRASLRDAREIGVYVSCSVELRSRFWLLDERTIERLQAPILRFFNHLLLEELFDTLLVMWNSEVGGSTTLGLSLAKQQISFGL